MKIPPALTERGFMDLAAHIEKQDSNVLDFAIRQLARGTRISHQKLKHSNASSQALLTAMAYGYELHRRTAGQVTGSGSHNYHASARLRTASQADN